MDKKNITTGVLLVAVGLLVLLNPETCIKVLIILLGAFSVVKGIYDLAKMRSVSDDDVYKRVLVVESLVSILIGIAALVAPFALFNTVQEIVRIMLYVFLKDGLPVHEITHPRRGGPGVYRQHPPFRAVILLY